MFKNSTRPAMTRPGPEATYPGAAPTPAGRGKNSLFVCLHEHCDAVFGSEADLRKHLYQHRQQRRLVCPYKGCGKVFFKTYNWQVHQRVHTGERPWPCPHPGCGQRFRQKSHLTGHSLCHISAWRWPCTAEGCGRSFRSSQALGRHSAQHGRVYRHFCAWHDCNKGFHRTLDLVRHLRTHSGARPFGCPHCGKAFSQQGTLGRHLLRHSCALAGDQRELSREEPLQPGVWQAGGQPRTAGATRQPGDQPARAPVRVIHLPVISWAPGLSDPGLRPQGPES